MRHVGSPWLSRFLLGWATFVAVDIGKRMMGTRPREDDEEVGRDPDEAVKVKMLSLVGISPVLVSLPS